MSPFAQDARKYPSNFLFLLKPRGFLANAAQICTSSNFDSCGASGLSTFLDFSIPCGSEEGNKTISLWGKGRWGTKVPNPWSLPWILQGAESAPHAPSASHPLCLSQGNSESWNSGARDCLLLLLVASCYSRFLLCWGRSFHVPEGGIKDLTFQTHSFVLKASPNTD